MCMNYTLDYNKPLRIICLTEESVETLFAIGAGEQIIGVSSFVRRPLEAQLLPKISLFTSSNIDKILEKNPDLVLGFSDIQKDIAKDLIGHGVDVWIANHRSINETIRYIKSLSLLVGKEENGKKLIKRIENKILEAQQFAMQLKVRPRVYFEEWDEPLISAIRWVSEVIEMCGGENIFKEKGCHSLAKDRFVEHGDIIEKNPDIIFACHCGKKVNTDKILNRDGYQSISAICNKQVFELEPEIFLQPGPAPFLDGIDIVLDLFKKWSDR